MSCFFRWFNKTPFISAPKLSSCSPIQNSLNISDIYLLVKSQIKHGDAAISPGSLTTDKQKTADAASSRSHRMHVIAFFVHFFFPPHNFYYFHFILSISIHIHTDVFVFVLITLNITIFISIFENVLIFLITLSVFTSLKL